MNNDLLLRAYEYARMAHQGQLRDDGRPFIEHPTKTAEIISQVTDDENLIAAALLHDTIEDTEVTYEMLFAEFGRDIADLVHEVTKEGQHDSHGYYFPRLKTRRGIMLKFADRLSNLSDMNSWDEKQVNHYLKKSKFWRTK